MINDSAMHLQILLKFGALVHHGSTPRRPWNG